jgi:hypothetical protein
MGLNLTALYVAAIRRSLPALDLKNVTWAFKRRLTVCAADTYHSYEFFEAFRSASYVVICACIRSYMICWQIEAHKYGFCPLLVTAISMRCHLLAVVLALAAGHVTSTDCVLSVQSCLLTLRLAVRACSALAVLASGSGVSTERETFMDLVKTEITRLNGEVSNRGSMSMVFHHGGVHVSPQLHLPVFTYQQNSIYVCDTIYHRPLMSRLVPK